MRSDTDNASREILIRSVRPCLLKMKMLMILLNIPNTAMAWQITPMLIDMMNKYKSSSIIGYICRVFSLTYVSYSGFMDSVVSIWFPSRNITEHYLAIRLCYYTKVKYTYDPTIGSVLGHLKVHVNLIGI